MHARDSRTIGAPESSSERVLAARAGQTQDLTSELSRYFAEWSEGPSRSGRSGPNPVPPPAFPAIPVESIRPAPSSREENAFCC